MPLPNMFRVEQRFDAPKLDDILAAVDAELSKLMLGERIGAGESVAVTAGSRGIANIAVITKAVVGHLRGIGAEPFVVPAMGSHGGGTAEGQAGILAGYGITEDFLGCPVRSSMETVVVAETPQGIPVHFDKHAHEADHVLVAGRVKPHTGFVGEIESGLHKMMLIGLGKHEGAKIYHRAIQDFSFPEIVRAVGNVVLECCGVVAGLAIVENAYDETGLVEAVRPEEFYEREVELLKRAKAWMPRLPFDDVDLLIVDRIGKDISGSGMDTNVIGRKFNDHAATDRDNVACRRILVRGLTEKTHGNGLGIGMAEFTLNRVVDQIDHGISSINAITGGHPTAVMIPIAFETDREAIEAALSTCGLVEPENAKVVQISDTLHLRHVLVSEAYAARLETRDDLTAEGPFPMPLDDVGNLADVDG